MPAGWQGWEFAGELSLSGAAAPRARRAGHQPGAAHARQYRLPGAAPRQRRRSRPGAGRARWCARATCWTWCTPFCHPALAPADQRRLGRWLARLQPPPQPATGGPGPGRCEGPGGCQPRAGDRRCRRPRPVDGGPAGLGQVHAGAALCRGCCPPWQVERGAGEARPWPAWPALRPRGAGGRRTTRQPHHTASAVALVGGAHHPAPAKSRWPTKVCCSLDELPEFPRSALEALREPLETGHITIARAAQRAEFPARFQLDCGHEPLPLRLPAGSQRSAHAAAHPTRWRATRASSAARCWTASTCTWRCPPCPPSNWWEPRPARPAPPCASGWHARTDRALAAPRPPQPGPAGPGHGRTGDAAWTTALQFLQRAANRLGWSARSTHRALQGGPHHCRPGGRHAHWRRPRGRGGATAPPPGGCTTRSIDPRICYEINSLFALTQ